MVTIKAFTDIEQSKKLSELLSFESADMSYYIWKDDGHLMSPVPFVLDGTEVKEGGMFEYIPCWSLAALYHILPNTEHISTTLSRGGWEIEQPEYVDKWWCEYEDDNDHTRDITITADNPVDACYEIVIRLNELNLL